MKKIIVFAICSFFLLNSCNKEESNPLTPTGQTGAIGGGVFTMQGVPIPDVNITTQPPTSTQTTNGQGNFYIGKVSPGDYTVTATKTGYSSITQLITVFADTIMPIAFMMDLLGGTGTIAGKVTGANNSPLAGAMVSTIPTTYGQTTNEFGNFLIENVNAGTITIIVTKQGYSQSNQNVTVNAGITTVTYITLITSTATNGTITGKITDNNNNPIVGASISTQPPTTVAQSNNQGNYTIANVVPGNYLVNASKSGYTGSELSVVVNSGGTVTANLQLTQVVSYGAIAGTIRDNLGNPIVGASVSTSPSTNTVFSDNNGNYTLANIVPGTYSVQASKTGYNSNSVNAIVVANNTVTVDITLTTTVTNGTITGRITDTSGNGINSVEITTQPTTISVITDNSGYYTLSNITPGTYTVNAVKTGYTQASQSASVTAGNITTVNLVLTASTNCPANVSHEGKTYQTVLIGTQCWFKDNLDIGQQINSLLNPSNNGTIEKYCYDNLPTNCAIYGGLYSWDEAMKYVTTEGSQGICPAGWHIPTRADLVILNDLALGQGKQLLASGQGNGTNETGFSALLAGGFSEELTGRAFWGLGTITQIYSSTTIGTDQRTNLVIPGGGQTYFQAVSGGLLAISVRCLKD